MAADVPTADAPRDPEAADALALDATEIPAPAPAALAPPDALADDAPFVSPRPPGLESPELDAAWRQGIALERRDLFLEAAAVYQHMADRAPTLAYPFWKVSRNYWRFAESLPADAKDLRLPYFELADAWATRGLGVDPDCAECMLWKFGAMGRIGTTNGVVRSIRMAPEMQALIERGIALAPAYRDGPNNSTLGNLHYAGAVFYRVVPEWTWLAWLIGVRGDLERSLRMIRRAVEIDGERIDYHVELGAVLLCYAERRGDDAARAEARRVLRRVAGMPHRISTDAVDAASAEALLERPALGCGFSRDGWIDVESERRAARG